MTDRVSNDNDPAVVLGGIPDAHGQAAMLLVESLLHGLIARATITVGDAVEILDSAMEIEREIATAHELPTNAISRSSVLLGAIRLSLAADT